MNLSNLYEIEKTTLDLLDAAGFHDVESLADSEVEALHTELKRVNLMRRIVSSDPSRSSVEQWIGAARDLVGEVGELESGVMPVNHEPSPEVALRLSSAPFALPLPSRLRMEKQLALAGIPPVILLNRSSGDLDVNGEERLPRSIEPRRATASEYVRLAEYSNSSQRFEIDSSKIRSTDNVGKSKRKSGVLKSAVVDERVALICGPRQETNKGRNPESRWYIRGVLHTRPFSVFSGALVTLLVMIALPCSLVAGALLFLSAELPDFFGWVPRWLLSVPIALPLFGVIYLIWGVSGSCRVCGQKLFVHRSHIKNPKAHRIRGLGYILPLCIHVLVFCWFRCTHCGTPVRLKE